MKYPPLQIARMICGFFRLCQSGEEAKLQEQLAKLPPSNLEGCQQVPGAQNGSCQVPLYCFLLFPTRS